VNFIAAVVASLALVLGTPAPVATEPVTTEPAVIELAVDPVMEADAYATYDFLGLHPNQNVPLKLEYVMTVDWDTEDLKRGEFVLASRVYPGKFHVMTYSRLYYA
jgi:hypothetical protein